MSIIKNYFYQVTFDLHQNSNLLLILYFPY